MSFKKVRTAGDLMRFGCSLRVECTACHAATTLSAIEVMHIDSRKSLEKLRTRFKCSRCGKKAAKLTVLPPV
jgi:hypothetical protein